MQQSIRWGSDGDLASICKLDANHQKLRGIEAWLNLA